jgi:hypothetical protein
MSEYIDFSQPSLWSKLRLPSIRSSMRTSGMLTEHSIRRGHPVQSDVLEVRVLFPRLICRTDANLACHAASQHSLVRSVALFLPSCPTTQG